MLKLKDKSISAYKGDYRPVEVFKNTKKLHGFQIEGLPNNESLFEGTYNFPLSIFGKSEYVNGVNLCPPPIPQSGSYSGSSNICNWSFTTNENGRFDFTGAMAAGVLLSKVRLPAGTYTVSGCEYVSLWWKARDLFLPIPATFTLEEETEVSAYFWYTEYEEIAIADQYIQIEKGETATDFSPYSGNTEKPVGPFNIRPVISASGTVRCEGPNLLPPEFFDFDSWVLDTESTSVDSKYLNLDLKPGKYVLSFDSKPLTSYIFLYLQKSNDNGQKYTTIAYPIMNYSVKNQINFEVETGCEYRVWSWRLEGNLDLFSNWQLKRSDMPNKIYPHAAPVTAEVESLRSIEVSDTANYNYKENADGLDRYYISDVLTGNTLTRYIGELILDENMSVEKTEKGNSVCNYFSIDCSDYFTQNRNMDFAFCNALNPLYTANSNSEGVILGMNDKKVYLALSTYDFSTVDDVVKWLKNARLQNNPITLYYLLDEPIIQESDSESTVKTFPEYTRIIITPQKGAPTFGAAVLVMSKN